MSFLTRPLPSVAIERRTRLREFAESIVALIENGCPESVAKAEQLLVSHYGGNSLSAMRAYEKAFVVAMRRIEQSLSRLHESNTRLNPRADWLALQSLVESRAGRIPEAFHRLYDALSSGARPVICRTAGLAMISELPIEDTQSILSYRMREVVGITIGRVRGCGLVILGRMLPRYCPIESGRFRAPAFSDGVHLLKLQELSQLPGGIPWGGIGRKRRIDLDTVVWGKLFDRIEASAA